MIETQMAVKAKQVTELETQAEYLEKTVPEKMDEIKAKKVKVEERFQQLKAPLLIRQQQLEKKKEAFQVTMLYLFFSQHSTVIVQLPERYFCILNLYLAFNNYSSTFRRLRRENRVKRVIATSVRQVKT